MNVKLELSFESLEELKAYLDISIPKQDCCCANPVPDPMPVAPEPNHVHGPVQPAPPMVQPPAPTPEADPVTPPPMVTAPSPVEPVPTPTPQADTPPSAPTVSTAAHTYKLEDIARAGASLVGLGKQAELGALLKRFGIASLPELPVDKYGEMALALREMGARI